MSMLRYKRRINGPLYGAAAALLMICFLAGTAEARTPEAPRRDRECCDLEGVKGLVWTGADPVMTFTELAAYCAPILWFSPDEPLLERERGKAIRLTQALPFEEPADAPVVYFKIDDVASRVDKDGPAFTIDSSSRGESTIDLRQVNAFDLRFCLYYPFDVGVGGHIHDLEVVDMKVVVYRWDDWMDEPCDECQYVVSIQKVIGRAHGLQWYDNHLDIDEWAEFPIGVLIEEGKHANCPDKNLDGLYTPNYDVNERVNDAWGIRDIIRGGELFTGGFESWMNKVRRDEDRVFPPLPEDSRLRQYHSDASGEYAPDNAIYELRPLPAAELALPDERLAHYIESKGDPDWPDEFADTDIQKLGGWLADEREPRS